MEFQYREKIEVQEENGREWMKTRDVGLTLQEENNRAMLECIDRFHSELQIRSRAIKEVAARYVRGCSIPESTTSKWRRVTGLRSKSDLFLWWVFRRWAFERNTKAKNLRRHLKGGARRGLTEARLTEARFTEATCGILCARFRALVRPKRAQDSLRHERLCSCLTEARAHERRTRIYWKLHDLWNLIFIR